jgi:hypothetical protein
MASHFPGTFQIDQELPNPFPANTGTRTLYIRQPKFPELGVNGSQDHFCLRPFVSPLDHVSAGAKVIIERDSPPVAILGATQRL